MSESPQIPPAVPADAWARLATQLAADTATTSELIQLLESERQCLAERDYHQFQQLLERKRSLLTALENGQQQRQAWLRHSAYSTERGALEGAEVMAPEVAAQWRELADSWQRCQELNQGNEQIAQRTRVVVGRVLDMLRGSDGSTAVYDASGRARAGGQGQSLGDA